MKLFSSLRSAFSSAQKQPTVGTIGATIGQSSSDEFSNYSKMLEWVKNTKEKLPAADPELRKEAFELDPLIKGIIAPFLKNTLIKGNKLPTNDNKRFEVAIKEIQGYIDEIALLNSFREDAADLLIKHGHSYRRRDYAQSSEQLKKLVRLEPSTIDTYIDPWDSAITAYHQHILVPDGFYKDASKITVDCWFIPGGMPYIQGEYEQPEAYDIFNNFATKNKIKDRQNLRVDSNSRIIAMHRVFPGDPAPIDNIILAIFLKRLLLVNSPNLIFRVLSPFIHVVSGKLLEITDFDGSKRLISSVPEKPSADLQATDPEQYNQQNADYESWGRAIKKSIKDIIKCLKDGGAFGSGPDTEIKVIESGRNVSYLLIRNLVDLLNEEICQGLGFMMALISASGAELATSRTILQFFNTVYAGARMDYEIVADQLIKERFENASWAVEIPSDDPEDQTTKIDTYTFKEMGLHFELETPDVKDIQALAEAYLKYSQELMTLKTLGASKEDIQALADERGYGMLGLDNFDQTAQTQAPQQAIPAMKQTFNNKSIKSAAETEPSGADGDELTTKLKQAYETAKANAGELFGH